MKKISFITMILILVLIACTLTACATTCKDGHAWKDGTITKQSTCTEVGEMVQKCENCGITKLVPINSLGHAYGNWTPNANGLNHSRVCANDPSHIETANHIDENNDTRCDLCAFEMVPAECQHVWGEWTDNEDGTCTRVCTLDSTHTESGAHVDVDTDEVCDNCGADVHEHNHIETSRTPADCENAEVITYTCSCGDSYTEEGAPATGHAYPAEWTDNGENHIKVCANDENHVITEAHTHEETGRTPADCENAEVITYTCVCGNTYTEEGEPAIGHDYKLVDNGDGTHSSICSNCDDVELTEDHDYVETGRVDAVGCEDGSITYTCDDCGNSYQETIPAVHAYGEWMANGDGSSTRICANDSSHTETVKFISGNTLNLEKGTLVAFYVDKEVADQYDNLTLEVIKPTYDESGAWVEDVVDTITNYDEITLNGINDSITKLRFMYEGISAKEMGVEFTGKLYSNGVYLTEKKYSVKQYVYKTLENASDHEAIRTLLVDMLNYGAAAQEYFGYLTDDLVNADLTEEQKAWATQEMAPLEETDTIVDGPEDSVQLHNTAISLVSVIRLNFIFSPGNHDINDIIVVFTYTDLNGEEKKMEVDRSSFSEPPAGFDRYGVMFSEYGATQIRDEVRISFKSKATGEAIGDSGTYSIESYLASVSQKPDCSEEFLNLVDKMVKYGDSSRAYFKR